MITVRNTNSLSHTALTTRESNVFKESFTRQFKYIIQ